MSKSTITIEEIACHFRDLEDPRSSINQLHPFVSVVIISMMAILAGANGPTGIAEWARIKQAFLESVLDLPRGIPGKDVFRRVLSLINPAAFQACFTSWLDSMRTTAANNSNIKQPILAVDGKTLRRSHDRKSGLKAMHSVRVWASEFGLSLGQVACEEKSNELTAIPELLKLVDITGAIITIDAMGTQKAIAKEIIQQKADYVLALKGNHEILHEAVKEHLDKRLADGTARPHTTTETKHGRYEVRRYVHVPVPAGLPQVELWKNLTSIGMAITEVTRDGITTTERRYFISSLDADSKRFGHCVRSHWGIENSCHWTLDMTFREDESRIRGGRMRENFAWLNRFTLSLLKQHPGKKSIVGKRRGCGWDEKFMLEVLTGQVT